MSSEDDDFRRAIALSIKEANHTRRHQANEPIVISSDEDESPPLQPSSATSKSANDAPPAVPRIVASEGTNRFLSERAQLEVARLARLNARNVATAEKSNIKVPSSPTKPKQKRKHPRDRDPDDPFVSSASDSGFDADRRPPTKKSKFSVNCPSNYLANVASSSRNTNEDEPMYWSGELRQTANMHVDRGKDARPVFRLHDILGNKSELQFIIMSSYVTQLSWIYSLLPSDVPVILVGQPDETGASSVHNVLPNWVKVTPFMPHGRGAMHVKFLMLIYKSKRLRIAIPTANIVDYDWRDIENSVWLQDFPPRRSPISYDRKAEDFPSQFERVLQSLNISAGLKAIMYDHPDIPLKDIKELRSHWDFSKVTVQLVPSIAGKHEGWPTVLRVGHPRLMRVVRLIGARADAKNPRSRNREGERKLELECQGSSIGTYTPSWIDEFYSSARGASPENWLEEGRTRRSKRLEGLFAQEGWRPWKSIKIVFPSLKTVMDSKLGPDGAGTMFCRRNQWTGLKFPRPLFHDSNSKRGSVLMHSKMILAIFPDSVATYSSSTSQQATEALQPSSPSDGSRTEPSSSDNGEDEIQERDPERDANVLGWLYVGSHNFTPSAWGNLSGTSFTPSLNITNFELGIVIPITSLEQIKELPCWARPPRKYGKDDEPWIQNG